MADSIPIIDSHVHLWPASDANPASHGWMSGDEHPLAKQYSINDYLAASEATLSGEAGLGKADVRGFVYIETDRKIRLDGKPDLRIWAQEPLKELLWLRRIVEGRPNEGEGHLPKHSQLVLGIIPWVPVDSLGEFRDWLIECKAVAGPEAFAKIKGFRHLLQGIDDKEAFERTTLLGDMVKVLKSFNKDGHDFSFDIGVDHHRVGVWQLEIVVEMIEKVHANEESKVTFILNHLCKPNLEVDPGSLRGINSLKEWARCIERFAKLGKVYMKLSGAFSELEKQDPHAPWRVPVIVGRIKPWLDILFKFFPAERIMFGSDWPVCNLGGPGDHLSWATWRAVVSTVMEEYQLSKEDREWIWWRTAQKAYRLDLPVNA